MLLALARLRTALRGGDSEQGERRCYRAQSSSDGNGYGTTTVIVPVICGWMSQWYG